MAELFLREALLMKDFWHAHVLGVIGVTFDPDGSPMVILPFMANGDLRKYIIFFIPGLISLESGIKKL